MKMKMKIKRLLLGILTLPINMFLLLFIGTLLLTMRIYGMRWSDKYLPAYKANFVETVTLGLYCSLAYPGAQ
uniref:Uncharacterized protein n=1 Tax=mine drainage metagenome TaxID=410659 RepID=E6QNN2_9ZZZZ